MVPVLLLHTPRREACTALWFFMRPRRRFVTASGRDGVRNGVGRFIILRITDSYLTEAAAGLGPILDVSRLRVKMKRVGSIDEQLASSQKAN
jgi:hypothetical protein